VKKKEQLQSLEKNSSFWTTYDLAIPLIQKYEWLHLKAYWDHAWYSIGWWTRAKHAKEVITQAEADKRLWFIVKQVITRVQRDFPTLSSKQQAWLVSFAFNCHNWYKDVVERWLDKHKYWCRTASGVKLQGLVNRRLEEQTLIFN
jgi:GH24 family phage-related lysozyme (muramidase)